MTFTYIVHLQRVIMNSHNNHSPVGLVAQLVDHCIGIAEVRVWILFRPCVRFSKDPKTLRARKAIRNIMICFFYKAGLFICCKGNKNKNNCKVSCLETPSFWRYKERYVTRNTPEKFRDFRKTGRRSPFAIAVIIAALKVKIKSKITSYQLILDRVATIFPMQKKYI